MIPILCERTCCSDQLGRYSKCLTTSLRRTLLLMLFTVLLPLTLSAKPQKQTLVPYRDASLPVEQRVSDLLQRMTIGRR